MELTKTVFYLEGVDGRFIGYEDPTHGWNGAAIPYFPRESVDAIIRSFDSVPEVSILYDRSKDAYIIIEDMNGEMERTGVEGLDYETVDGVRHLYCIGGWEWLWIVETRISDKPKFNVNLTSKPKETYVGFLILSDGSVKATPTFTTIPTLNEYIGEARRYWDVTDYKVMTSEEAKRRFGYSEHSGSKMSYPNRSMNIKNRIKRRRLL